MHVSSFLIKAENAAAVSLDAVAGGEELVAVAV
jgi:hypothetical protein